MRLTENHLISLCNKIGSEYEVKQVLELINKRVIENKKENLIIDFYINKKIINIFAKDLVRVIKLTERNPNLNTNMTRIIRRLQKLNTLESVLIYRDFGTLCRDLMRSPALNPKDRGEIYSQLKRNEKIGSEQIGMVEMRYRARPIINPIKWHYNRCYLLQKVTFYKVYLILLLFNFSLENHTNLKETIVALESLESSVEGLYRNKLVVWKDEEDEEIFELKDHMKNDPILDREFDREDYIRNLEYLVKMDYYNVDNISDYMLYMLYKYDYLYLFKHIPKIDLRLKHLLERKRNYEKRKKLTDKIIRS